MSIHPDIPEVCYAFLEEENAVIGIPTIKSFEVSQSPLHRLTGVCSIRIYTAGDQPEISLSGLPYPEELNDALQAAKRE